MLDKKQKHAISLCKAGYNLFITGNAGTGKSFIIRQIKKEFGENCIITSTTGISALNIDGITIHNWSGICPDIDYNNSDLFVTKIQNNYKKLNNYLYTQILIIDEISMLDLEILEFIDKVARIIRNINLPFGGIQVVFVGDFYQLPPVNSETKFSFESKLWNNIIDYSIILKKSYRQTDLELVHFLNKIRVGKKNKDVLEIVSKCNSIVCGKQYTHLYSKKNIVNTKNLIEIIKLPGEEIVINSKIINKKKEDKTKYEFPKNSKILEKLTLKNNSFLMITTNLDFKNKLVNGTQCKFVGFENDIAIIITNDGKKHFISKYRWDFKNYYIEQYPFTLAWAITIHKSQGMGIEYLSVDVGTNIFEDGQAYVALSRAKTLKGLHIKDFDISSIRCNSNVHKFYKKMRKMSKQWYKIENSLYKNKLDGNKKKNLPTGDMIIKYQKINNEISMILNNNCLITDTHECSLCDNKFCRNDYVVWFNEFICTHCIIDNMEYKQLGKKEFIINYYGKYTKSRIEKVLKILKFKPNVSNNRFKTKTKIYLVKHFEKEIVKYQSPKNTIKKPLNKTRQYRMLEAYQEIVKGKSFKEIGTIMNLSAITIQKYIIDLSKDKKKYPIPDKILVDNGITLQNKSKIKNFIKIYIKKNKDTPRLRLIKDNIIDISYFGIQYILNT